MELTIECQKRIPGSKPNTLRREGRLPAALYGHNGAESVSLTIDLKAAELLLRKTGGKRVAVQLSIPEMEWSGSAYMQEVQTHPWKGFPYHISFLAAPES